MEVYDNIATKYINEFNSPSDYLDNLVKKLKPNAKILDIGCGPGVDAEYMTIKGFRVQGFDSSKEMIKLAKLKAPKASFKVANILTFNYGNNEYHGIIASFSLIHVPQKNNFAVF